MKRRCGFLIFGVLLCSMNWAWPDDAADAVKWHAQIDKATQTIQAGGDDVALVVAYYNRSAGYNNLKEWDKADSDADAALEHIRKLPAGAQEAQAWVQTWGLKGDVALEQGRWKDAVAAYKSVRERDGFTKILGDFAGTYYYNRSRAYAHTDSPYESRLSASDAIEFFKNRTSDEDKRMTMLSLRQRAIARYGEGDLAGAQADWAAAKLLDPKLGEAPFDAEQAPLNKAALNGRENEHLARARYLLNHANEMYQSQLALDVFDDPNPEPGGTLSLSDATAPIASPMSLANDALNDLDKALQAIGETWGLENFDIALERGRARSLVFQLDPSGDSVSSGQKISPHMVDEEFNRAVRLRPYDANARRARADWLVYRLAHLNEMAQKAGTPLAKREESRKALIYTVNDDLGRALLAVPADGPHHIARARLAVEQAAQASDGALPGGAPAERAALYIDPSELSFDLQAGLAVPTPANVDTSDREWAVDYNARFKPPAKPTGTAIEWKEKAKAANTAKEGDKALEDLNNALLIDPRFADALNNRASVYIERAQWDLALRDFDAAIRLEPRHRVAYLNRSILKGDVGDFDASVADARQAVEVAPDSVFKAQAQKQLMNSLFARGDARSEKSETLASAYDDYHEGNVLAASLNLPPDSKWLQYEGTMAAQLGRGPQSLSALRAAHAAKPDDVWVEGWLAIVATALDEPDAKTLEQEVVTRGNRSTLSNLQDVATSLKKAPRLSKEADAELQRLDALASRLFDAYRAKPGGRVIDGGEKPN